MYVLRVIDVTGAWVLDDGPAEQHFIKSFSWEPFNQGTADLTANIEEARHFETPEAALTFYQQSRGLRADGKPNRPLTAFTVELMRV